MIYMCMENYLWLVKGEIRGRDGLLHLKLQETWASHLSQSEIIKMKVVEYFKNLIAGLLNIQSSTAVN